MTRYSFFWIFFLLLGSLAAQQPQLVLPIGHTEAITTLSYLPNGKHLITGSVDKQVKLWKADGQLVRTFSGHQREVRELISSPDGEHFVSSSSNEAIIWNIDGSVVKHVPLSKEAYGSSSEGEFFPLWSPDGKYLALSINKRLNLINLEDLSSRKFNYPFASIGQAVFSDDGKRLFISTSARSVVEIASDTGKKLNSWKIDKDEYLDAPMLFLSPSGSSLFLAYSDAGIHRITLARKKSKEIRNSIPELEPQMIAFSAMSQQVIWVRWTSSPDRKHVFRTTHQKTELFKVGNDQLTFVREVPLTTDYVSENIHANDYNGGLAHPLQFSANGRFVLWRVKLNEQAVVYDLQENRVVSEFTSTGTPTYYYGPGNFLPLAYPSVALSPNAKEVAIGHQNGHLTFYDFDGQSKKKQKLKTFHQVEWVNADTSSDLSLQVLLNQGEVDAFFARQADSISRDLLDWRDQRDSTAQLRIASMNLSNALFRMEGSRTVPYTIESGVTLPENKRNVAGSSEDLLVVGVEDPNVIAKLNSPNPGSYIDESSGVVFLSGKHRLSFKGSESVTDVGLSTDNETLIVSHTNGIGEVWRVGCLTKALIPFQAKLGLDTLYGEMITPKVVDFNNPDPVLSGKDLASPCLRSRINVSDRSFVHGISSDGNQGLLSCGPVIYPANLNTGETDTLKGHSLDIIGAKYIKQDRFIVSWAEDRSVIIWSAATNERLLTLFFLNQSDWIATTPSGLFDASPGGMNALYYSVGFELLNVNQLKERYYEPGLLPKLLGYSNESIRSVDGFNQVDLFPEIQATIENASLHIELKERNGGIGKTSVFINGKEVIEEANPLPDAPGAKRPTVMEIPLAKFGRYFVRHPDSTNTISVRAYNAEGWLKSKPYTLNYSPPLSRGINGSGSSTSFVGQYRPKMYVISIGTRDYKGEDLDLAYPDKDALAMAIAFRETGAALFNDRDNTISGDSLEVICLSTSPQDSVELRGRGISWDLSSKTNIERVFRDIGKRAKAEDVIMVYFSGHGMAYGNSDNSQFYYLTRDVANGNLSDNAVRMQFAISTNEITDWLNTIPALKQVLIVDACNSGTLVDEITSGGTKDLNSDQLRALERMKDRTGMFIISGSASDKVSYEASEYGQGLLTYALLQGIISSGGTRKYIDVMTLLQYATDEVPRLAKTINGIQTPRLGIPTNAASFDIGIADGELNIPISKVKPVMIRSTFLNEATYRDDQQLATLLEAEFRKESEKGYKADLLYVNTSVYPGAYSISGIYRLQDGEILLSAKLFKDDTHVKDIDVPGNASAKNVVRYLKRAVEKALVE